MRPLPSASDTTTMDTTSHQLQFDIPLGLNAVDVSDLSEASAEPISQHGLRLLTAAIGQQHVHVDNTNRDRYARTTLPQGTRPLAIVRPGSTSEVVEVVNIARDHGLKLHPISRGKNWGYGDACAATDSQVIVDLRRMNQILEVNQELGYAVIQPGVTQGQMYEYLQSHKLPLIMDMTGAGPDASIVGNVLQRGFGHTPYGDRFRHTSGMEVVLPTGKILNTPFDNNANAQARWIFPNGVGPWRDGMFSQSNAGIVTKMGVWLMPRPPVIEGFALKIDSDDQLGDLVEAIRELRMQDIVRSTVHIANDLRVISSRQQYPWDLTQGKTPLPDNVRKQLRDEAGLGAWNVLGGLYGTRRIVSAARGEVRRALRGLGRVHFFKQEKLNLALAVTRRLSRFNIARQLHKSLESADSAYQLLCGVPTREHLKGVFWRSRKAPDPNNPDPLETGLIWISPVLPATASACRELLNHVEPIFKAHGFEPLITMSSVTSRTLVCVMNVSWDKDSTESLKPLGCYRELTETLELKGWGSYRLAHTSHHPHSDG